MSKSKSTIVKPAKPNGARTNAHARLALHMIRVHLGAEFAAKARPACYKLADKGYTFRQIARSYLVPPVIDHDNRKDAALAVWACDEMVQS